MHLHTRPSGGGLPPAQRARVRILLAAITIPLLLATIAGLALLWPRGATAVGSLPLGAGGVSLERGVVTFVEEAGAVTDPFAGAAVRVDLSTGAGAGQEVPVQVPVEILAGGLDVGDRITVMFTPDAMGTGSPYVFYDFVREAPIGLLGVLYLVVVVAVARWKGLAAVVGLVGSLAVTAVFVLPAIMAGTDPLAVVVVGSSAMMFLAVYLAHGVSIKSTTALLGTFAGMIVMVLLGAVSISGANLTGAQSDDALTLGTAFPELSLQAVLLCGLVIAGLGALNDVTITQASAVWELHAADPNMSRAQLVRGGMQIGRDHIASTIYTLAFAYVGSALPMLLLAALIDRTLLDTLMASEIAEEIVRTLVASVGLILAIPFTTALAAALVPAAGRRAPRPAPAAAAGTPDAAPAPSLPGTAR